MLLVTSQKEYVVTLQNEWLVAQFGARSSTGGPRTGGSAAPSPASARAARSRTWWRTPEWLVFLDICMYVCMYDLFYILIMIYMI